MNPEVFKFLNNDPILELQYNSLKHIAFGGVFISVFIIIYCFFVFDSAFEIKTNVGNYINLISERDGNTLPVLLTIPGVLCLLLNCISIYLIYSAFCETKHATLNTAMYGFIMVCIASVCIIFIFCIIVLTHSYGSHEKLHDGITDAMHNYSSNSNFKKAIDQLQIQFQCCGSKGYKEWYDIEWYDLNFKKSSGAAKSSLNTNAPLSASEAAPPKSKKEVGKSQQAPFSCCSMKSIFPCIHHNVESISLPYKYSPESNFSLSVHGCFSAIKSEKKTVGWSIIKKMMMLILLQTAMLIAVRFIQTAHFEKNCILEDESSYTSWLIGCYVKQPGNVPPPVPPIPNELKD